MFKGIIYRRVWAEIKKRIAHAEKKYRDTETRLEQEKQNALLQAQSELVAEILGNTKN